MPWAWCKNDAFKAGNQPGRTASAHSRHLIACIGATVGFVFRLRLEMLRDLSASLRDASRSLRRTPQPALDPGEGSSITLK